MTNPSFTLVQKDWSLHRKGPIDLARHNAKVKEAIKGNLPAIISDEAIITSDGKTIVKIPIRSLDLPRFRYGDNPTGTGQGNGQSKKGDVLGDAPTGNTGAGNEPGIDYYDAEFTVDEIAELVFADLGLPRLQPKNNKKIIHETDKFTTIRRTGSFSNLSKRQTIKQNIKRNAMQSNPVFADIQDDDLRFKSWQPHTVPRDNACVFVLRDISGSMGEFQKYISRSFFFWTVRFLRTIYQYVDIVFITHHTEAQEVDEKTFFTLGESGGTMVSSAYALATEIIHSRYPSDSWNNYVFHFSDGDNWPNDNQTCLDLISNLLKEVNMVGYGEIRQTVNWLTGFSATTLMKAFADLHDEHFVRVIISTKEGVYDALKKFFYSDL